MSTSRVLIESKTVESGGTALISFTNIPQTYTDLKLLISSKSSEGGQSTNYWIQFNSDTGANYTNKRIYSGATTAASDNGNTSINGISAGFIPGDIANTTSTFSNCEVYIPNYTGSTVKSVSCDSSSEGNQTSGVWLTLASGLWNNTAAITSLTIAISGSGLVQQTNSTFYLYGISNVTSTIKATGGIVSSDGTYNYHMFPYSGTFTPTQNITVDYLVIAGGGGGGYGGGGAGGLRSTVGTTGGGGSLESALSLTANTGYTVTVGAGGTTSGGTGTKGGDSVFSTITSEGGGLAKYNGGGNGGSGGGTGGGSPATGGTGTANQGFNGGSAVEPNYSGGGGAGQAGENGNSTNKGGNGGAGVSIPAFANATQTGVNSYYAGGGGGASSSTTTGEQGLGGAGGGANATYSGKALAGIVNTGGGGAGSYSSGNDNSAGGSGLVIIRYAI